MIETILERMTLREKIEQLNQIMYLVDDFDKLKERIKKECIGSVILATGCLAGCTEQETMFVDKLNELQETSMKYHNIPLMFGRDVIHGHNVVWPIPLAMSATFNPDMIKKSYEYITEEANADGVNWFFSPMIDLARDPRWGRIVEGPGEDPYLGAKMAEAAVKGIQGEGEYIKTAACAKHFVGYGASEGGRDYHRAEISDYSLRNYYLKSFDMAVKSGVATVMNSFNEISGEPTTSSKYLLGDVLRGEMGFEGFVISDWGSVEQLVAQGVAENDKEAATLAVNAGVDMDMAVECYYKHLEEAVKDGSVSEDTINEAVRRVLSVKQRMNLFNEPYMKNTEFSIEEHRECAKECAKESIVLLKNNNHTLPLNKSNKIGVMGSLAQDKRVMLGTWTLDFDLNESITVYDGIKTLGKDVMYFDYSNPNPWEYNKLLQCDTLVLVLGEHQNLTGEAESIVDIEIDDYNKSMIKFAKRTGKKIVGVMLFGRPRALESVIDDFDAVIYAWHSGSKCGQATAEILFGVDSPSGRLPVTFPRVTGQIPIFYNYPPSGRPVNEYYDEPERWHNYFDCKGSPLYPFGFGLSYTEFSYGEIMVNKKEISLKDLESGGSFEISIDIKNSGNFDSKETVQCYIRDSVASMTRPIKELKGIEKMLLKAGEKKKVSFFIGKDELGFYNRSGEYVVEKGEFKIYVGKDCMTKEFVTVNVI